MAALALAGFALSPEPSAPAAPLVPVPAAPAAGRPVSMTVDEVHEPRATPVPVVAAGASTARGLGPRWGTDIGWPQCGRPLPQLVVDLTILQVTSGRPGTVSPCLAQQVAWARSMGSAVNAYVVPGSPSAADLAAADPAGRCHAKRSCLLRAAGAADAAHALAGAEAAGLSARGWWLDVEEVPARTLWGTDTAANSQVLAGWRDELRRAGKVVGVYSTRGYWRQVAGHWRAGLPQWAAVGLAGIDAAGRACGRPFTSGPVLLGQWLTGPLDGNRLCPGQDALARQFFGSFGRVRTAGVPDLLVIPVPHPDVEAAARAQAALEAAQAAADRRAAAAAASARAGAAAKARADATARAKAASSTPPVTGPPAAPPVASPPAPTPVAPAPVPAPAPPPADPTPAPAPSPAPSPGAA